MFHLATFLHIHLYLRPYPRHRLLHMAPLPCLPPHLLCPSTPVHADGGHVRTASPLRDTKLLKHTRERSALLVTYFCRTPSGTAHIRKPFFSRSESFQPNATARLTNQYHSTGWGSFQPPKWIHTFVLSYWRKSSYWRCFMSILVPDNNSIQNVFSSSFLCLGYMLFATSHGICSAKISTLKLCCQPPTHSVFLKFS